MSPTSALVGFVALGFALAAANLRVGAPRAGKSFQEERPSFLRIFLVPAAAAGIARRRIL